MTTISFGNNIEDIKLVRILKLLEELEIEWNLTKDGQKDFKSTLADGLGSIHGLWKDRDITAESLRKKAMGL